jgi:(E)-4-hydroxy-3-methylbut-2-enyl-diphosphate synthase
MLILDFKKEIKLNQLKTSIKRRKSSLINVGSVPVGGDSPISVQSMTNSNTEDVDATVAQILKLEDVGADIVRVSTPSFEAVDAFREIKKKVNVPLVADIHFDYKIAIAVAEAGADCLRINPGNIGSEKKVKEVVSCAEHHGVPIRIGVNAGSLEKKLQKKYGEPCPEALFESAMAHVEILLKLNFDQFKLSIKASNIFMMTESYRLIAKEIIQPLHLGLTEAGGFRSGTVKSAIAIGELLREGIGDTLRVSLASDPVDEIKVGFDILKSLGLRKKGINFIACPSCSRQNFDVIKTMNELEVRLEDIKESIDVAVIGCYVNGPGESKAAHVGLTGASPRSLIYIDGSPSHKIENDDIVNHLEGLVREKVKLIQESEEKLIAKS